MPPREGERSEEHLIASTVDTLLAVGPATSGADDSGGVTGGVYKARERIHRGMLIRDY